jgi:hypothetical protein
MSCLSCEGRINLHKQTGQPIDNSNNTHLRGGNTHWTPYRGTPYGVPTGRGGGRHQQPHRNRTLVLNASSGDQNVASNVASVPSSDRTAQTGGSLGWVTRHDRHNQLINTAVFDQKNQERIEAIRQTTERKRLARDAREKSKITSHLASLQRQSNTASLEVEIDHQKFRVTDDGSKLIRVDSKQQTCIGANLQVAGLTAWSDNPNTARSTPKRAIVGGVTFLRSKNGNLYRSGLVKKEK